MVPLAKLAFDRLDKKRAKTPKIVVKLEHRIVAMPPHSETFVVVRAENHGESTVVIESAFISLPDKKRFADPWLKQNPIVSQMDIATLPYKLEPGRKCFAAIESRDKMESGLPENGYEGKVQVRGCVKDELSREWYSEPFDLDLDS